MSFSLLLILSAATPTTGLSSELGEHSSISMLMELADRGIERYGCWADTKINSFWTAPTDGGPVLYYEVEVEGDSNSDPLVAKVAYTINFVFGTELDIYFPANIVRARARCRGWNSVGEGPWSEWNDWFEFQ